LSTFHRSHGKSGYLSCNLPFYLGTTPNLNTLILSYLLPFTYLNIPVSATMLFQMTHAPK